MKKGGFLRNVLDTIRSNQASGASGKSGPSGGAGDRAVEFGGQLKPSHFSLCQVARHGFPDNPTALAFDPVQKIAAIGTKSGALRIFGRPGAEVWAQHEPAFAVTHIKFVVNQGALITVTADESIHLWSLRGPNLKLQFTAGGQGGASNSPQASSPAPTPASNISSVSPQSVSSTTTTGIPGATSTAASPSSFLGQITDTVSGAVDSASDFLTGGAMNDHFPTPSPTSENKQSAHRRPEILHTLKFQREHITFIHQTLTSKWLYIGTERGNVHVANVETFELSGYSIAWNKAIELSRKAHPGAIIHLSECPQDTNKLLIGYESGCIVLWDLKQRNADGRYYNTENLLWLAWHYEGKQFVAAHGDGSLITWQTRSNQRPAQILHPHAKTAASAGGGGQQVDPTSSHLQSSSLTSSLARSLNNELYRPINKVEWKTAKSNNEQFYLFSGGLPYDGFDQASPATAQESNKNPSRQSTAGSSARSAPATNQSSQQKSLQASSGNIASLSPITPSVSPNVQQESLTGSKTPSSSDQRQFQVPQREKKSLRSTSLTVMYGRSITVLEMDDTIIDFITICDNSPYENDTSEPYAVIVLLSNELILIDLTSSGYPSFDSPYSSASLSESPVTCVQYLADCSSDLIPFLYSTSQNVISRAPKKGFSEKEWPINGGEWGQSMQSYPELVLTGHADGTIKFWDMSGVNFDLISKIKTSKLFEKPNKPPNAIFISINSSNASGKGTNSKRSGIQSTVGSSEHDQYVPKFTNDLLETSQTILDESLFAIEKIEFCSTTKRLLVAGACAQVIQFKLNKKEPHSANGGGSAELTTIFVEPSFNFGTGSADQHHQATNAAQWKQHSLFKVKGSHSGGTSSTLGGSSSSSSSNRSRAGGFNAELICLTPSLISTHPPDDYVLAPSTTTGSEANQSSTSSTSPNIPYYCQIPPKITALAFQATHNILAYAHSQGIVLVDIIQKCVIMNATLSDLYGGGPTTTNRDISIQPYATSSILQHHYQSTTSSASPSAFACGGVSSGSNEHNKQPDNGTAGHHQQADSTDNERTIDNKGLGNTPDSGQFTLASGSTVENSNIRHHHHRNQISDLTRQAASAVFELVGSGPLPAGHNNSQHQQSASMLLAAPGQVNHLSSSSSLNQLLAQTSVHGSTDQVATSSDVRRKNQTLLGPPVQQQDTGGTQQQASSQSQTTLKSTRTGSSSGISGSNCNEDSTAGFHTIKAASHQSHSFHGGSSMSLCRPAATSNDKFDSSFRRSRSSSTSSTTAAQQQAESQSSQAGGCAESIQCIAFVDPGQAGAGLLAASGVHQGTASSLSGPQTSIVGGGGGPGSAASGSTGATGGPGGGAVPTGQVQSPSVGPNHKSLSQIDGSQLALWLGTSTGSVLLVSLQMPDNEDNRVLQLQSINAEAIPQAGIKLSGQILCLATFTCEARPQYGTSTMSAITTASGGAQSASQSSSLEGDTLMQSPSSSGSSSSPSAATASAAGAAAGQQMPGSGAAAGSMGSFSGGSKSAHESPKSVSFDTRSSLFFAVVSEKRACVYQVPANHYPSLTSAPSLSSGAKSTSTDQHHYHQHQHPHQQLLHSQQSSSSPSSTSSVPLGDSAALAGFLANKKNLIAECDLSETSYSCRSAVVQMRSPEESCLVSYLATGNIVVHSLPRLRPVLMDADFTPYSSPRISSSMNLARNGHCLYQPSAGEISKFTISAQYKALVNDMIGLVYVPREMPEMPRTNFFKSLFSVSQSVRQSDRDELFGECSAGKPSRGVAKHLAGSGSAAMDKLKGAAVGTMGHEMRMAREGLDERGEKLSEIEDRTLSMMNQAEGYSQAAHQLAQKFKDKKWYQF